MFCSKCGALLYKNENGSASTNAPEAVSVFNTATETPSASITQASASAHDAATNVPLLKSTDEYITTRIFSSKKNILNIILAVVLILGLGVGIMAIAVAKSLPYNVSQGIQLAERFLSEQNYEYEIIEYEKILEIEPMNVDAYLGLVKTYDITKTVEILREGLEQNGDRRIKKATGQTVKLRRKLVK